jgi:hypothetical protein
MASVKVALPRSARILPPPDGEIAARRLSESRQAPVRISSRRITKYRQIMERAGAIHDVQNISKKKVHNFVENLSLAESNRSRS